MSSGPRRKSLCGLLIAFFAGLFWPASAMAQFTLVSGTVTDPSGIPYDCGTISAQLVVPGGTSPTLNGASFTASTSPVRMGCTLTPGSGAAGSFLMRLADNSVILPSGTQWQFTVNMAPGIPPPAGAGPQSFSVAVTVTGASQSVSTQLNAAAPKLGANILAGTHSGTETFKNIGNVVYVSSLNGTSNDQGWAGADAFGWINSAAGSLQANGGTVDARGLGAQAYTVTTQLTAMNSATKPIHVILPDQVSITTNVTGGVCAAPIGDGSMLETLGQAQVYNPSLSSTNKGLFQLGPTANVSDLVCPASLTGSQQTMGLRGISLGGNATAVMSGALLRVQGVFAGTVIQNIATSNCFGKGVLIQPGTTTAIVDDVTFINDNIACGGSAGSVPLTIDAMTSGGGTTVSHISFIGGAIQNQGSAQPLISINGRGNVLANDIYFCTDLEVSSSSADTVQIVDIHDVRFCQAEVTGTRGTAVNLFALSETVVGRTYDIDLSNISFTTPGYTSLVNNAIRGTSYSGAAVGGIAFIPRYYFNRSGNPIVEDSLQQFNQVDFNAALTIKSVTAASTRSANLAFQDNQATPASWFMRKDGASLFMIAPSGGIKTLADSASNTNLVEDTATQTLTNKTLTNPIINGTVTGTAPLTQTIASGTAVMTTAAILAGACGTTVTVAATGVATTDTITWAFNAAPGGQNAGLVAWPTAGNVNFAYCSNTAETPAAATINWRVMR